MWCRRACVISHISIVVLLPVRALGKRCATLEQETLSLAEKANHPGAASRRIDLFIAVGVLVMETGHQTSGVFSTA